MRKNEWKNGAASLIWGIIKYMLFFNGLKQGFAEKSQENTFFWKESWFSLKTRSLMFFEKKNILTKVKCKQLIQNSEILIRRKKNAKPTKSCHIKKESKEPWIREPWNEKKSRAKKRNEKNWEKKRYEKQITSNPSNYFKQFFFD
jgi:hypothetical protein